MINILLCGNDKVFDCALCELISITNKTKEPINCIIFTCSVTRIKKEYTPISDSNIQLLNDVVKAKNKKNKVIKIDVTKLYNQEFKGCPNESAYCSPYTLLRLLADLVPEIPDKILYLDMDMMIQKDLGELYNKDISEYEYAACREKYGSKLIRPDYINAGMLLLNMKKIKETKLFEKGRNSLRKKKLIFADQDAIFWNTTKKKLLPRIYNEQRKFNCKKTVICHFAKRLWLWPYPHTVNYKQWDVENLHKVYHCHAFDDDLKEFLEIKENINNKKDKKKK